MAPELIESLHGHGILVGDHAYDSNRLYDIAGKQGWQLVAPRLKGTRLGKIRHSRWRLRAHKEMTEEQRQTLYHRRQAIERFFGYLGNMPCGLNPLPNWLRGRRRIKQWVQAKLIIYLLQRLRNVA